MANTRSILFLQLTVSLYNFQNFWNPHLGGNQNSSTTPLSCRDLRVTGARVPCERFFCFTGLNRFQEFKKKKKKIECKGDVSNRRWWGLRWCESNCAGIPISYITINDWTEFEELIYKYIYIYMLSSLVCLVRVLWHGLDDTTIVGSFGVS